MPEQFRHKGRSKAQVYQEKKQRKQRKYLSSRERRSLGLMTLPTNSIIFAAMKPLQHLWNQYMDDLKSGGAADQFMAKLIKADFHGAHMTVTQATCPTLIGISGIVVQETAKTFNLVTQQNVVKSICKQGTVFSVVIGQMVYHLYGHQLQYRSSERAARKFKGKPTIEL
ncbi:ribonuclease P protein subunit p29 [Catenaria anguillulae PL171]|uniref:Ribonuclease P protein subunit p29 n=1 Tax=Catenaria anguillulae PL171 TaxID=765915 RepID=A0A1Y2HE40_9FUNG|nr:ribonuclease P protein subunit p29 [Catenaria anguillulae PL171]